MQEEATLHDYIEKDEDELDEESYMQLLTDSMNYPTSLESSVKIISPKGRALMTRLN